MFPYYKGEKELGEQSKYCTQEAGMTRRYEGKPLLIGNGANTIPLRELNHNNTTDTSTFLGDPHQHFTPRLTYSDNSENKFENISSESDSQYTLLAQNIDSMSKTLRQMEAYMCRQAKHDMTYRKNKKDWKTVAIVMDRLFFIIYVIIIILSVSILFPRPI